MAEEHKFVAYTSEVGLAIQKAKSLVSDITSSSYPGGKKQTLLSSPAQTEIEEDEEVTYSGHFSPYLYKYTEGEGEDSEEKTKLLVVQSGTRLPKILSAEQYAAFDSISDAGIVHIYHYLKTLQKLDLDVTDVETVLGVYVVGAMISPDCSPSSSWSTALIYSVFEDHKSRVVFESELQSKCHYVQKICTYSGGELTVTKIEEENAVLYWSSGGEGRLEFSGRYYVGDFALLPYMTGGAIPDGRLDDLSSRKLNGAVQNGTLYRTNSSGIRMGSLWDMGEIEQYSGKYIRLVGYYGEYSNSAGDYGWQLKCVVGDASAPAWDGVGGVFYDLKLGFVLGGGDYPEITQDYSGGTLYASYAQVGALSLAMCITVTTATDGSDSAITGELCMTAGKIVPGVNMSQISVERIVLDGTASAYYLKLEYPAESGGAVTVTVDSTSATYTEYLECKQLTSHSDTGTWYITWRF